MIDYFETGYRIISTVKKQNKKVSILIFQMKHGDRTISYHNMIGEDWGIVSNHLDISPGYDNFFIEIYSRF